MQHGNFLAKAIASVPALAKLLARYNDREGVASLKDYVPLLEAAQVFMLPDPGYIFEPHGDRYIPKHFKLPYPVTAFEFSVFGDPGEPDEHVPQKRLTLFFEPALSKVYSAAIVDRPDLDFTQAIGIIVWSVDADGVWWPCSGGLLTPLGTGGDNVETTGDGPYAIPVLTYPHSPLENNHDEARRSMGFTLEEDWREQAGVIARAAESLMQVLCALECKNVRVDNAPAPSRLKKALHKNLPLITYKVLTVPGATTTVVEGHSGATHASPRTHLRRGHVRRLDSGNIWVQSTVVKGSAGLVIKDYSVPSQR